jgi:hypothetical protein
MAPALSRGRALAAIAALAASALPSRAFAERISRAALADALPAASAGTWVRYIVEFGASYQKQIGFGIERTPVATRYFVESQVGMPGGSCNPDTIRKAYLRAGAFAGVLTSDPVTTYIARANNMLVTYDDSSPLRLLDVRALYADVDGTLSQQPATARVPSGAAAQSQGSLSVAYHHAAATRALFRPDSGPLRSLEIVRVEGVPLGLASLEASIAGAPAFSLRLDSYGHDYQTEIADSLDAIRAEQP